MGSSSALPTLTLTLLGEWNQCVAPYAGYLSALCLGLSLRLHLVCQHPQHSSFSAARISPQLANLNRLICHIERHLPPSFSPASIISTMSPYWYALRVIQAFEVNYTAKTYMWL